MVSNMIYLIDGNRQPENYFWNCLHVLASEKDVFCKHFLDKIAKYFWTLLQNVFGHCCMSKLDKVAMPRLAA